MKALIARFFLVLCAGYILDDWFAQKRYRLGKIGTKSGSLHSGLTVEQSVAYIEEVFSDYKKYSGVEKFHGQIAEIGPGDNCGVGLLFIADGCESVDLVDRFYSKRNNAAQASIYRSLGIKHPLLTQHLENANLEDESSFHGLQRHYGSEAAAEQYFLENKGYDFIVSRAVFEHLYDPLLAIEEMAKALKPGGMLLHKVDLRDHGMFSSHFHELKFLEIEPRSYLRMTLASGRPNRVLLHRYRESLTKTGLNFSLLITRLAGYGDVVPHVQYQDIPLTLREKSLSYVRSVRSRFSTEFQNVSDEDLSVAGFFLVAKKRAG